MLSTLALLLLTPPALLQEAQEPEIATLRRGTVVAETWTTALASGGEQAWFRLSLDSGRTFSRDRATHYRLALR